jgi:hypothetical protein
VWFGVLGALRVVADGAQEPQLVAAGRLRRALGPQAGARVLTRSPGYLIELFRLSVPRVAR